MNAADTATDSTERPTVIDELCGHLTASAMMRVTRRLRDEAEAARIMALYGEATTTEDVQ